MSKPIAEVREAARPLPERILAFLRGAPPDQAYTVPEIYVAVERVDPQLNQLFLAMWAVATSQGKKAPPWAEALEQLVVSKDVEKSTMNGTDYYWAARRVTP